MRGGWPIYPPNARRPCKGRQIVYHLLFAAEIYTDSADIGIFRENFDFKRFLFLPSGSIKTI